MAIRVRARRFFSAVTAVALVGGGAVAVTAPAARATTPAPGDWVFGNADPVLPANEERDPNLYDAVPAGPSGTLLTSSRWVPSPASGIVLRTRFGLLPGGPDVEPAWVDPLPGVTTSRISIDADPVTGDAVALLTGQPSGTLAGPYVTYVVEYDGEAETWSAPRTVPDVNGTVINSTTDTDIAIRDGVIQLAIATRVGDVHSYPYEATNTVTVRHWALGTDPATATTEAIDEWISNDSGYPPDTNLSFAIGPLLLPDRDGTVHLLFSRMARDLYSYGPPYGPTPGDPRSVFWSLVTARGSAEGWTSKEDVLAPRNARNQRWFVVTDSGTPTIVVSADELATPGTEEAGYTDATYTPTNRSVVLDGEHAFAPLPTPGRILPTAEGGWHGRVGMRLTIDGALTELYLADATAPGGLRAATPPTGMGGTGEGHTPAFGQGADGAVWAMATCTEPPATTCVARWNPGGDDEWVDHRRLAELKGTYFSSMFVSDESAVDGVVLHALPATNDSVEAPGRLYRVAADDPDVTDPAGELLPPPAPTGVKAKARSGGATLSWTPRSDPALHERTTGFTVTVSPSTRTGRSSYALAASAHSVSISSLRNGVTYTFRVYAQSGVGDSDYSTPVKAKPIGSPARPTKLKATKRAKGKTKLTWKVARSTTAHPVTGYRIYVKGKLVKTLQSRTAKSWTHGGEKEGRTYTYRVYAYNALGKSTTPAKVTKKRR